MDFSNKTTNIAAVILLVFLFTITLFGVKGDSLTMDELAHLPSGYSYLTQKDMRLNPEHPPLIKDLAAFPLLFIEDIKFPPDIKAWREDTNGQWDFGRYFLFKTGNSADQMILWSRIPMILLLAFLGFFVFKWTRELFGNKTGLLSLFLFSLSPTLIAHGALVTTDVGAAAGILIATYYFIKCLQSPTKKNIIIAGLVFGIAQLIKFSVILLLPFFVGLALIWWLLKENKAMQLMKILLFVFLIGFLLVWPIYQYHTWNYPAEKQVADAKVYLKDSFPLFKEPVLFAADKPILRPYAQYLTGLGMVFHRVAGGNTTYFLGDISNKGWRSYFPIVYLIKEPLSFHILTLLALISALFYLRRDLKNKIIHWLKTNFSAFAMLSFIGFYWLTSIVGDLNIGIRHLLPVFPLTIILISAATINWLKKPYLKLKYVLLAALILWQIISVLSVYPHFLAYFNEAVGGPANGYKYVVDSNLDWGQDLKRLKTWVDENKVDKIYVDYFGGAEPEYYLKEKYASWWGTNDPNDFPKGNYLAVSVGFLQGGIGNPTSELPDPTGFYKWLEDYTPVAKIGYSIFVYYID